MTNKETKEPNQKFAHCVYNKAVDYYKTVGIAVIILILLVVIAYAAIKFCEYVLPSAINLVINTPVWITIPALVIITPLVAAVIECWIKRKEKAIKQVDEEYTCPE